MIELVERHGPAIPQNLKQRLDDDAWFKSMLGARYPTMGATVFVHSNYPKMIAEILEIEVSSPLRFEGGSASAELSGSRKAFRLLPGRLINWSAV